MVDNFYKYVYRDKSGKFFFSKDGDVLSFGCLPDVLYNRDCYLATDGDLEAYVGMQLGYSYVEELLPPFTRRNGGIYLDESMKYIAKAGRGKYAVRMLIGGVMKHFGLYDSLIDAKKVRDIVVNNRGLSYDDILIKLKHSGVNCTLKCLDDSRYITNDKGKFFIRKWIAGKMIYFGTFSSFDEAKSHRDRLISVDWNESKLGV